MHKAMYERIYGQVYEPDSIDVNILNGLIEIFKKEATSSPRVGEVLKTEKGYLRFTHAWDDGIQTTVKPGYDSSFFFGKGYMSFSGSLAPSIPYSEIELTEETMNVPCWFFSHNVVEAHNGVHVYAPCRVWKIKTT